MNDRKRIAALGGPHAVAGLLKYKGRGGVQRVRNWMTRGIPAAIKLQRPDLFPLKLRALHERKMR